MSRDEAAALLGVPPGTTGKDAQRAFLRAARFVHPDVLHDADEGARRTAAARFDALVQARAVLLEPPFFAPGRTAPAGRASGPAVGPVRRPDRNLGDSLVLIAMLSFLIVALLTLDTAIRTGSPTGSADVSPVVSTRTP